MRGIFSLVLIISVYSCFGQKADPLQQHDKLIRLNFTSLFDPLETNLSLGFEYRIKDRTSLSMDVGYVFFNFNLYENAIATSGIILRPAIRYYTDARKRFFVEGELHIKSVNTTIVDWIDRKVVNNVPTFQEFAEFKVKKNVVGLNFKIGYQARLSRDNSLWLEPYVGLGAKLKSNKLLNEPDSRYSFDDIFNTRLSEDGFKQMLPNVTLGIRFLVKI